MYTSRAHLSRTIKASNRAELRQRSYEEIDCKPSSGVTSVSNFCPDIYVAPFVVVYLPLLYVFPRLRHCFSPQRIDAGRELTSLSLQLRKTDAALKASKGGVEAAVGKYRSALDAARKVSPLHQVAGQHLYACRIVVILGEVNA